MRELSPSRIISLQVKEIVIFQAWNCVGRLAILDVVVLEIAWSIDGQHNNGSYGVVRATNKGTEHPTPPNKVLYL